ncbi:MAG: amphi-Trp domain-containing protein [Deltaproteobacteria bacterium]|nr:amphi-Trp domain-containing protein [Deltaproteobacteria bacterium]
MEKKKVVFKQTMETAAAVEYLESLVKAFKAGRIVVEQGETSVELLPGQVVDVEVEAKVKEGKAKFEMELGWMTSAADEGEGLSISDKPSEPVEEKPAAPCPIGGEKAAGPKPEDVSKAPKSVVPKAKPEEAKIGSGPKTGK